MCSVLQEDFELDDSVSVKSNTRLNTSCKKCSEKAVIVLQKRHSYCKSCFLKLVSHKFRSTLGKTKLIKHDEKILVISYGDANSIAMLHLLEQGMSENAHKRIKFKPTVLFISETSLWPSEFCEGAHLDKVLIPLKSSFDTYIVKLSSVYADPTIINLHDVQPSYLLEKDENDVKLMNNFSKIKSATSKIDFILRLRYLLQTEIARKLHFYKIFTPECGSNLAVRLLSDVILGRGSQISSDIAVCDDKLPELLILRPLREITTKEVTFYNVFNELEFQSIPSLASLFNLNDSIQGVTETFISGLQEEFPSTVYTIFHTGDKLKNSADCDKQDSCIICHNKIDATNCSIPLLPKSAPSNSNASNSSAKSCDNCSCKKKDISQVIDILRNSLCYGCNRLINDMDTTIVFPSSVAQKIQIEKLRTKIEDFLL